MNLRPDSQRDDSGLLTITLEKLVYGGNALGRISGKRAAFVPFGLPGERVKARVVNEKREYLHAELIEVLEPSQERIPAKCKHFGACGGCHYQHLSYPDQLKIKTEILRDQLIRIGKIPDPPIEQIVASQNEWNYRNHVQFHLTRDGKLGYFGANGRGVMPISECHLLDTLLNKLWPTLEFDPDLELERISLRVGVNDEVLLVLESDNKEPPELELEANLSVVHLTGDDMVVMAGDDHICISIKDRLFRVSAASFFQVNTGMAGNLVEHLLEQLPMSPKTTLLDVYCGVGLFSAFFAERVGHLIGVEASPSACEDFADNLDEFENVELYEASAEIVLPRLQVTPNIVVVDPPRAGLDRLVLGTILAMSPTHIAYISCDPSTLGRDAARFIGGGYRLVQVTPFDLFPQTYSIESISIFEKALSNVAGI